MDESQLYRETVKTQQVAQLKFEYYFLGVIIEFRSSGKHLETSIAKYLS